MSIESESREISTGTHETIEDSVHIKIGSAVDDAMNRAILDEKWDDILKTDLANRVKSSLITIRDHKEIKGSFNNIVTRSIDGALEVIFHGEAIVEAKLLPVKQPKETPDDQKINGRKLTTTTQGIFIEALWLLQHGVGSLEELHQKEKSKGIRPSKIPGARKRRTV